MNLLRVIATLDPRHGGPAAGLRAITPVLAELGHRTTFVSVDRPGVAPPVPGAILQALGPAHGGYAYSARLSPWLRAHAADFDAVFVHGLWQYPGRAVHAALRGGPIPYFVFPHGMLDPWFREAYPLKHLKKRVYWRLCEYRVLRDAAAVCFTCDEERRLARCSFRPYDCCERVVAYGTAAPPDAVDEQRAAWRDSLPELGLRPFWLFLGRVHPKKGIDLLLRAYGRIAAESPEPPPALVLAGPSPDRAYRRALERMAATLPRNAAVIWTGMLEGARKWGALRSAEAFVLPSHQENFGLAVAEALAAGTPVLISDKVNIREEIVAAGAGFSAPDDLEGTVRLLQLWRSLPELSRTRMRVAARELFCNRYEVHRAACSLVDAITPFTEPRSAAAAS